MAELTAQNQSAPPIWVKDEGFTVLANCDSPVADVVFIHGLQGNPRRTWRYKGVTESQIWVEEVEEKEHSFPKRLWKSKGTNTRKGSWKMQRTQVSVFWPADLLPTDHANIRILTYGYDSKVTKFFGGATNQTNIDGLGRGFLTDLEIVRRSCPNRPLIFIAHSLGGLIVKEALRRSRDERHHLHLKSIYEQVQAITFFGTPHRGSPDAAWGNIIRAIAKVALFDTNAQVIKDLDSMSTTGKLDNLNEAFSDMLLEKDFMITTFQETQGKAGTSLLGLNSKVVPDFSSALDDRKHEIKETLNASHMDMCRFKSKDDPGYVRFKDALSLHLNAVRRLNSQGLQECIQSLYFDELNARKSEIVEADSSTFHWILDTQSDFVKWLQEGQDIYWICGKPGSGKSTLMKSLQSTSKIVQILNKTRHGSGWTLVTFYFTFKGTRLEKSLEGLLRSFLLQLLRTVPALHHIIKSFGFVEANLGPNYFWDIDTLKKAFISASCSKEAKVCLLIDALDEYEGSIPELIALLKLVNGSAGQYVKICVASRPHANILLELEHSPGLRMEDCNRDDITIFVQSRLASLISSHAHELNFSRISADIVDKSDGVFLWASFAVNDLIEGFAHGDTTGALEKRMEEMPRDLEEVYRRILRNVNSRYRLELLVMLHIVCYAETVMSLSEFKCAINCTMAPFDGDASSTTYRYETDSLSLPDRQRFIRRIKTISGGLLDVVINGELTLERFEIKLLHKTVKTFLNLPNWNEDLIIGIQSSFVLDGQEALLKACAIYSRESYREFETVCVPSGVKPASFTAQRWPFLEYARKYLPQHARLSEVRTKVSSRLLLRKVFQDDEYQLPSFEKYFPGVISHDDSPEDVTELELAVGHGMTLYCEDLLSHGADPNSAGGRPIRAAVLSSNVEVVKMLLERGAIIDSIHPHANNAIVHAAIHRNFNIIQLLVQHGADVNAQIEGKTALYAAVNTRDVETIQYLLLKHANVDEGIFNDQGVSWKTPLQLAAITSGPYAWDLDILRILLQHGADVNAHGEDYGTALQAAVHMRHKKAVTILLEAGADPTLRGGRHGSALQAALKDSNREIAAMIWVAAINRNLLVDKKDLAAYRHSNVWIDLELILEIIEKYPISACNHMYYGGDIDQFLAENSLSVSSPVKDPTMELLASDYEAMMAESLTADPGLDTLEQTHQTWHIKNWKKLQQYECSPLFECGGTSWQIALYPSGNHVDWVSIYLLWSPKHEQESKFLCACAKFALVLWSPTQPSRFISHVTKHRFSDTEKCRGFRGFCTFDKLILLQQSWKGYKSPLVENEETRITAYIRVIKNHDGLLWQKPPKLDIEDLLTEDRVADHVKEKSGMLCSQLDVCLVSNESFRCHRGFDLTSTDLALSDPAAPKTYVIHPKTTIRAFAQQIAEEKGLKTAQIRFWIMQERQNRTIRPEYLTHYALTFEEITTMRYIHEGKINVWAEFSEICVDGRLSWPDWQDQKSLFLVFLKHFETSNQSVIGIGHVYVRKDNVVGSLCSHIINIMNWATSTPLILLEEIKPSMIVLMQQDQTFSEAEIQDGDIIRFSQE